MIKNITIAALIGIIVGQTCKADTTVNTGSISRKDLFAAAALCGILANPYGFRGHPSQDKYATVANFYANKLMQDSPAAQ